MQKIIIGVLMGGKSIEREVSFNSGRTICDYLDTELYQVIPLFQTESGDLFVLPWHFLHRGKTTDFIDRLPAQAQKIKWDELKGWIDFVYIALHGRYAEDGTLQGMLEILGIPYLGSKVYASALRIDKSFHKEILRAHGIAVPNFVTVTCAEINAKSEQKTIHDRIKKNGLEFPLICKPCKEGSSLGIVVVHNADELESALHTVSWVDKNCQQNVVIEEKLSGMEFCCVVLVDPSTNEFFALTPTEIIPEHNTEFFDYDQKYMPGRATKITPARVTPEQIKHIQDVSIKVMKALELTTLARIDGFLTTTGNIVVIDPNSLSGTDPASFLFRQAAESNMSHTQVINHLIHTELVAYGKQFFKEHVVHQKPITPDRLRIAVLFGGNSHEREISLESGRNVVYKLSPHKYEAIPIFVNANMELFQITQRLLVRHSTQEIADGLADAKKLNWNDLPELADFVFIALHGGLGENGAVQGALEMLGLPYNGSGVLSSALCMNKFKTAQFLKYKGFAVPNGILITREQWQHNSEHAAARILEHIAFPCIVKPYDDGCSVLVAKSHTLQALHTACDAIFATGKDAVLIEECIVGMELTVGIIGNDTPRVLPPSQVVVRDEILSIEEKFLPGSGENKTPALLDPAGLVLLNQTMEAVYKVLDCKGYVRVDCFFQTAEQSANGEPRIIILEVNSLPALTPATCLFHQAAEIGLRPMEFIDFLVTLGLQEHHGKVIRNNNGMMKSFEHPTQEI